MYKEKQSVFYVTIATLFLLGCGGGADTEPGNKNGESTAENVADTIREKVIYGEDNRLDLHQLQDQARLRLADSTVALIFASDLQLSGNNYQIKTTLFANNFRLPLCQSEPFREQDTAPFCSGFLVAPNLVATAGHCVQTEGTANSDCTTTRFVFGYGIKSVGSRPLSIPASEVYGCKRIVKAAVLADGSDYSIVELDRSVPNHQPLKLRRSGTPAVGDSLVVIGNPSGLPTKVADGAKIRTLFPAYIRANLDTYGGNSGSAVFNAQTNEVEGILVRGEEDFVVQGNCMASKRCDDNACRGEDVTRISLVLPYVPELAPVEPGPGPGEPPPVEPPPAPVRYATQVGMMIPDNNAVGITAEIMATQAPRGRKVKVEVNITHTWRGDLVVTLVAPNGAEVVLANRKGRSADDIVGVYGANLNAEGNLSALSGVSATGSWRLRVQDRAARDVGRLNSWALVFD